MNENKYMVNPKIFKDLDDTKSNTIKNVAIIVLSVLCFLSIVVFTFIFLVNGRSKALAKASINGGTSGKYIDPNTGTVKDITDNDSPLVNRYVYYAGLEDSVIKKDTAVYLENLKKNEDIFMAYEVYDDKGNLVFETNLIPSGEFVRWVPGENFESGEYEFSIKHIPYYGFADEKGNVDYVALAYQPVNVVKLIIK